MKVLYYLTSVLCTCHAGILSGYGGNLIQELEIVPQQLQHVRQVDFIGHHHNEGHYNAPQTPIEIVKIQSVENSGVFGGSHSVMQNGWKPIHDVQYHSQSQVQPQIIKVIQEHASNIHGRHSGGQHFGRQSQPQIIKIIEEHTHGSDHGINAASSRPHQILKIIEEQSYSGHGGNKFEHSYAHPSSSIRFSPPHTNSSPKSSNFLSSIGSFFPQLLELIFGDGGDSSQSSVSVDGQRAISSPSAGKLIDAYGYKGIAKITKAGKNLDSYFNSGHVIESGTLEVSSSKGGGKW